MGKYIKSRYFILIRIVIMLIFGMYGIMNASDYETTGVSLRVLLLVSFFISVMALKELSVRGRPVYILIAGIILAGLLYWGGPGFILLAYYLAYELLFCVHAPLWCYFLPYAGALANTPVGVLTQFVVVMLLSLIYAQHAFVVLTYKKQMQEETADKQGVKRDLENLETAAKAELQKNMLKAENRVLEERAELSQTLHDKLGHNINGSIYQLEAAKVLMESDPEKTRSMLQAVIDQLRTGMDEIRAILRRERPEKKKMALLQIYELCDDCNKKGVEAELSTEGDLGVIPGAIWEVILDNAFEAVSNAMKYARCKHIRIEINVMNKLLRCSISDDGVGCSTIVDGMGLSGMRQRTRAAGGTISFEAEAGFRVNMLLPL